MKKGVFYFAEWQGIGPFSVAALFTAVVLFIGLPCCAQQPADCATPFRFPNSLRAKTPSANRQLTGNLLMRMFVHLCRDDNGANQPMTEAQIREEVRITDSVYGQGGICFAVVGVDYLNNTALNNDILHTNIPASGTLVPNCFNVYIVKSVGNAFGTAFAIPNNYIAVVPEGFGPRRTFLHELAHDLGLFHTYHGGAEESDATTCAEWVNGGNGNTCGDYVADTPADPYVYPGTGGCNSINYTTCVWNGTCRDANNQLYSPDMHNYMGAWVNPSPVSCDRTHFSTGQFQRMRQLIADTALLSDCVAPAVRNLTNAFLSSVNVAEAAGSVLNAGNLSGGDYKLNGSVKAYLVAPLVLLKPGFLAQPSGTGYVIAQPGICQ